MTAPARSIYFFLSYAHTTPIPDDVSVDPDYWVRRFYEDLRKAVAAHADPNRELDIGFVDYELSMDSDWKAQLSRALGAAEVFVPLYSPGYLNRRWPLSERDAFRRRLAAASGPHGPTDHIQPVLWIPVESDDDPDLAVALRLGSGSPAYAENGLRAMRMLEIYRSQYEGVVDKLARQIVRVAERSTLGLAPGPTLPDSIDQSETTTPFMIAVLAPSRSQLPAGRHAAPYTATAVGWRPFEARARPIAEYAANVVERFDLPARVVGFEEGDELLSRYPGVVLMDPWMLADATLERRLLLAIDRLRDRPWLTTFVLVDSDDSQYAARGRELADRLAAMLAESGQNEQIDGRRVWTAHEVKGFVDDMPMVVAQTRRHFLKQQTAR